MNKFFVIDASGDFNYCSHRGITVYKGNCLFMTKTGLRSFKDFLVFEYEAVLIHEIT